MANVYVASFRSVLSRRYKVLSYWNNHDLLPVIAQVFMFCDTTAVVWYVSVLGFGVRAEVVNQSQLVIVTDAQGAIHYWLFIALEWIAYYFVMLIPVHFTWFCRRH